MLNSGNVPALAPHGDGTCVLLYRIRDGCSVVGIVQSMRVLASSGAEIALICHDHGGGVLFQYNNCAGY